MSTSPGAANWSSRGAGSPPARSGGEPHAPCTWSTCASTGLTLDSPPAGSDLPMAYLEVTWRVLDARRAVASQPIDVVEECLRQFVPQLFRLGQLHAGVDQVDVSDAVRANLRLPIDTPNGLRIEDCVVWLGARRPVAGHDTPDPEPARAGEPKRDVDGRAAGTHDMPLPMDQQGAVSAPDAGGKGGLLVHAQFVPDAVTISPAAMVPLDIVVDNHDNRARTVRLQLGGAMYRYSSPQLSVVDVPANSQHRLPVEVTASRTGPEGGRVHGLTVTATDVEDGTVLGRSTGQIAVRPMPALDGESPGPHHVTDPAAAAIPVVLHNRGNLPLDVGVCPASPYWWVRRPNSRRARRRIAALDADIESVISRPVVHGQAESGRAADRRTPLDPAALPTRVHRTSVDRTGGPPGGGLGADLRPA